MARGVLTAIEVTITCTASPDEARALAPRLEPLWKRSPAATPFQHPAWWVAWMDAFGAARPVIAAAWLGDRPVGALPLYCTREADGDVLRILGCGNTDYLDALVDRASEAAAATALAGWIDEADARLDLLDLAPDAALTGVLRRCRRPVETAVGARCPVVSLPASPGAWRGSLPHGLARNLRRYGRQLEARAETRVDRVTGEAIGPAVEAFLGLHAARWGMRGEPGVLADPAVSRFHRAAIPALDAAGVARLYTLRHGGRVIAAQYVLVAHGRAFSYLSGFDPEFARFSPGSLLMASAIEAAIDEGCASFDLLRGDEPYKAQWATAVRVTSHAVLPRSGAVPGRAPRTETARA